MLRVAIRQSQNSTRRPDKTLRVAIRQSQNSTPPGRPDKTPRRHPAVTKQYLSVGRIRRFASLSGSHKTVLARRPDKMLRVAIRQSQNSTLSVGRIRRFTSPSGSFKQYSLVGRIRCRVARIRQSDERYQDTSNWFIRRINHGSSSVPRSANSA